MIDVIHDGATGATGVDVLLERRKTGVFSLRSFLCGGIRPARIGGEISECGRG
jgi:hypothetical protein